MNRSLWFGVYRARALGRQYSRASTGAVSALRQRPPRAPTDTSENNFQYARRAERRVVITYTNVVQNVTAVKWSTRVDHLTQFTFFNR